MLDAAHILRSCAGDNRKLRWGLRSVSRDVLACRPKRALASAEKCEGWTYALGWGVMCAMLRLLGQTVEA